MPLLGDCDFKAEATGKGQWVGRCRQFPDLRSRPRKSKLDAIDDIVDRVSDKIRDLDAATAEIKAAAHG